MKPVDSEHQVAIEKAVHAILSMNDGETAKLEDLLGQKYDTFTLLSIGSTIEPILRENKIWLKFEGEYDYFQCKYKFPFQKGTEYMLTINHVFSPQDSRYITDNALVEKYEIQISKDVTINGRVTFLAKKDNRKITVNEDFTKIQTIDITRISTLLSNIQQHSDRYVRIPSILDDVHHGKTIIKINSVEYLFNTNDAIVCELADIINNQYMYQTILQEKQKGIRNGLYPSDL